MDITIVKFHPFEGVVRRTEPEFHGDSHCTTPMARNEHEKMFNLCMGITMVKFHPFSMMVPPKSPEFHGQGHYTTPIARNEKVIYHQSNLP